MVHHILLYYCVGDVPEGFAELSETCLSPNMPEKEVCSNVMVGWAVGGEVIYNIMSSGIIIFL